jgi:hypothetical protein
MKRILYCVTFRTGVLALALLSAGCASYPMGLNKAQWEALPAEKQAEYRAQQYQMDEARRQQAAAARAEQERQMAEARRAEQARITALYQQARYRDIVTVTISHGVIINAEKSYRLQPVSLDLVLGETKSIRLVGTAGNRTYVEEMSARFSPDGNTVYLNEDSDNNAVITLVNGGWERGATTPIGSVRLRFGARLNNAPIHVRYKSLSGEPERVIIERR